MKILVINPNTSQFVTDKVCQVAADAAGSGFEFVGVTGRSGSPIVGTRAECALASKEVMTIAAEHAEGCDGVLLAISFDSGLDVLREILDIPVVGISEAGMSAAMSVSRRFAMLTFGDRAVPLYEELVEYYGWTLRCAGVISLPPLSQEELEDTRIVIPKLIDKIEESTQTIRAEAIVLTGAVFAGIAEELRDRVSLPIVDGVVAGVNQLKMLHALNLRKPVSGSLACPPSKKLVGLPEHLTKMFKAFGSKIDRK